MGASNVVSLVSHNWAFEEGLWGPEVVWVPGRLNFVTKYVDLHCGKQNCHGDKHGDAFAVVCFEEAISLNHEQEGHWDGEGQKGKDVAFAGVLPPRTAINVLFDVLFAILVSVHSEDGHRREQQVHKARCAHHIATPGNQNPHVRRKQNGPSFDNQGDDWTEGDKKD